MTLRIEDPSPVIYTVRGTEIKYRVAYETEVRGWDGHLMLDIGELPNLDATYRIRLWVEQIEKDSA